MGFQCCSQRILNFFNVCCDLVNFIQDVSDCDGSIIYIRGKIIQFINNLVQLVVKRSGLGINLGFHFLLACNNRDLASHHHRTYGDHQCTGDKHGNKGKIRDGTHHSTIREHLEDHGLGLGGDFLLYNLYNLLSHNDSFFR